MVDTIINNLDFGYAPLILFDSIQLDITSGATRCGFNVPFWLNYKNRGTKFTSGIIELELDDLTHLIDANPQPNQIEENKLTWNFQDLPPTHSKNINLTLNVAGVENIGDTLELNSNSFVDQGNGELALNSIYTFNSIINCAYDPNDKISYPKGIGEENFTIIGEDLDYTIRFQNTGTDTAFNVILHDQLDNNLDWSSMSIISSSHNYELMYNSENRLLEFSFKDILLPDSSTNYIGSQGFIKYNISHKNDIEEYTNIENSAKIYFDFNPYILTNTTSNTFISEPIISNIEKEEESQSISIYPNPFSETLTIDNQSIQNYITITISDINGVLIKDKKLYFDTNIISTSFPSGIYFYKLTDSRSNLLKSGKIVKIDK